MSGLSIFVSIVYIILCVAMLFLILSQEGKQQGLGAIGGHAGSDTYWAKIKGHTREGMLPRITAIISILFLVI